MLSRRVSGRPGAEGAPFDGCGSEIGICWRVLVLSVWEGWLDWGAMRRDWGVVSWFLHGRCCCRERWTGLGYHCGGGIEGINVWTTGGTEEDGEVDEEKTRWR